MKDDKSVTKEYTVIVGFRGNVELNHSCDVKAKSMKADKEIAKTKVPAYWTPVVRDIWRID